MSLKQDDDKPVFIPKETIKRLLLDVKELIRSPLDDQKIYYKHSDEDIMKGYALMIGPDDSLYEGGYYFFKFEYPINYPHSPPFVTFLTNDGKWRVHPNYYTRGKVCLSILNTWRGEQWTGCQTIKSVLLTMLSLFDKKPLLHEPGIRENHNDFEKYNQITIYKNIEFAICKLLDKVKFREYIILPEFEEYFFEIMRDNFLKNKDKIKNRIISKCNEYPNPVLITTSIYDMVITINYKELLNNFRSYE